MSIFHKLGQCFADKTGATAIEYGFIASLISIAAAAALQLTGTNLVSTFTTVATNM